MKATPVDRKYMNEHVWISADGDIGTCGITDFAQEQLTDILVVQLPAVGKVVAEHDSVADIESVKSVSDVFAPLDGEVISTNQNLLNTPDLVNSDPYGDGWIFRLRIKNTDDIGGLMSAEEYDRFVQEHGR